MMFAEQLAVAIVKGEKTQTSRVLSDNPRSPCYGTGLIISPAAVALIAKVEREGAGGRGLR